MNQSQRNVMYHKNKKKYKENKNIIITQMMVGEHGWREEACMLYRWAGEASIQVKEPSSNNGYEAEGKAF